MAELKVPVDFMVSDFLGFLMKNSDYKEEGLLLDRAFY